MSIDPIRICVQKFHHNDEIHKSIGNRIVDDNFSRALFMNSTLWPAGSTIKVSFVPIIVDTRPNWYPISFVAPVLTAEQLRMEYDVRKLSHTDAVKLIVNSLVQPNISNIKFKFVDEGLGDVRVRFDSSGGSSSLIGTQCLQSFEQYTLTFGWMDIGTIIHEFSHVLGMLHEHQNTKSGIQWNRAAVYKWAKTTQGWDEETTNVNILDSYPTNEISSSNYDPSSVMLYYFPPELTLNGVSVGENLRYSQTDINWLSLKYGGGDTTASPPATSNPPNQPPTTTNPPDQPPPTTTTTNPPDQPPPTTTTTTTNPPDQPPQTTYNGKPNSPDEVVILILSMLVIVLFYFQLPTPPDP